ncbi:MAG: UTP--glucose-phosphate uridylyltransferase [Gammaproteobacteria bacterium]|jgi:UTP--glucose-1-phosphate uridylyltransferase|nr:UTP--glucose-phosphate uridylyltransferase [Gammaproteobacteria bacterium]
MRNFTIRKAVFPVAGIGTRFLPATKANPKEMLPIVDKPLIQYAVEEAIAAGVTQLIFITSSNKRAIEDHFDTDPNLENHLKHKGKTDLLTIVKNILPQGVECVYVRQPQPLGLGHAVLCAKNIVEDEPFAVLLADDLIDGGDRYCLEKMVDVYKATRSSIIAVEHVAKEDVQKYGIIEVGESDQGFHRIERIVEKPKPAEAKSTLAAVGRYILTPGIFKCLENITPGSGGEIQLTDAIAKQLLQEKAYIHELTGIRYDCGSKLGYLKATIQYGLKHTELGNSLLDYLKSLP